MLNKETLLVGGMAQAVVTLTILYKGGDALETDIWVITDPHRFTELARMSVKLYQTNTVVSSVPVGTVIAYDGGSNPPNSSSWIPENAAVARSDITDYPHTWTEILGDVHITDEVWAY